VPTRVEVSVSACPFDHRGSVLVRSRMSRSASASPATGVRKSHLAFTVLLSEAGSREAITSTGRQLRLIRCRQRGWLGASKCEF